MHPASCHQVLINSTCVSFFHLTRIIICVRPVQPAGGCRVGTCLRLRKREGVLRPVLQEYVVSAVRDGCERTSFPRACANPVGETSRSDTWYVVGSIDQCCAKQPGLLIYSWCAAYLYVLARSTSYYWNKFSKATFNRPMEDDAAPASCLAIELYKKS